MCACQRKSGLSLNFELQESCKLIAQLVDQGKWLDALYINAQYSEVRRVSVEFVAAKWGERSVEKESPFVSVSTITYKETFIVTMGQIKVVDLATKEIIYSMPTQRRRDLTIYNDELEE